MNKNSKPNENIFNVVRSKMEWVAKIVVVGLVCTLVAAVVLPRSGSNPGQVPAATSQIANLATALGAFKVDNGYYPRGSNGLMYLMQKPPGATNWHGPYMEHAVPVDPWGHAYIYESPGRHNPQGYDLSSKASDGREFGNWKPQ
jgi:general secretion pathway protein G